MKNMNLILVIFLSIVLAAVVYNRMGHHFVAPKPPVDNGDELVVPDKPPVVEEPKTEEIKIELLEDAKNFADAIKMAKEHKRPIFMFFGANWCHWCQVMKTGTLVDAEVKAKLASEYVVYFVDTDKVKHLARKFKISGIPVSMIIDAEENVIARSPGAMSKADFLSFLEQKAKTTSLIEHNFDEEVTE